jgi:hypothetical protein
VGSPPASGAIDAGLRRIRRVLAARSCAAQQAQLSACFAAAGADDSGAAAAARGRCAQYAAALTFCEETSAQFPQLGAHTRGTAGYMA